MKKMRFSIPFMLFFLLLVSFGSIILINWLDYTELKNKSEDINQKRIMDKVKSNIILTKNYDMLFKDLVKGDDYITELHSFSLDGTPLTKSSSIEDKHKDLFFKTVRSTGSNKPFPTEDNNYIFMHIDPDGYESTGDEVIVVAKLKNADSSFISKYFRIILNASIGLVVIIIIVLFSIILINLGLSPLRNLVQKIPLAMNEGVPFNIKISGDKEVRNIIDVTEKAIDELNEVNRILSELSKANNENELISTFFRLLERKGMKSIVILNRDSNAFRTISYKGTWKDEKLIKNLIIDFSKSSQESELFSKLINTKSYVEITPENKDMFSNVDIDIFGVPSIYIPIMSGELVDAVIGGNGTLEPYTKQILSIIASRWGSIVYGIIKSCHKAIESTKIEPKIQKENISENTKNIIEKINEKTLKYNENYKEGINLAKEKRYEEALSILIPLVEAKEDALLLKTIGACYFNIKDYENACKYWEKAIKLKPSDNSLNELLRKVYEKKK